SSKILPCVSSCSLSTPKGLADDAPRHTSCSGSFCESSGLDGKNLSSWSPPEPLSVGTVLGSGCIGNGFQEPMFWASSCIIGQNRCDRCNCLNVLDAANQCPTFVLPPQPSNVPTSDSRFQDTR